VDSENEGSDDDGGDDDDEGGASASTTPARSSGRAKKAISYGGMDDNSPMVEGKGADLILPSLVVALHLQ